MNTHFNVSDQELAAATGGGVWGLVIEGGIQLIEATKIFAEGSWMEGHHPPHIRRMPNGSIKKNQPH